MKRERQSCREGYRRWKKDPKGLDTTQTIKIIWKILKAWEGNRRNRMEIGTMASICLCVEQGVLFQTSPWILAASPNLDASWIFHPFDLQSWITPVSRWFLWANAEDFKETPITRGNPHLSSCKHRPVSMCNPEARIDIMRSLRHPHIVELHFSFQDESHVYLGRWIEPKTSTVSGWCSPNWFRLLFLQTTGMEFAEGGGMFDLLSKQLCKMRLNDVIGYSCSCCNCAWHWTKQRSIKASQCEVWQIYMRAGSPTFLSSVRCAGVLAHPNTSDYS